MMKLTRRDMLSLGTASLATALHAQERPSETDKWPARPVRFVIPYPPGSASDSILRALSDRLAQVWKVPTIVENKPGGNTVIAVQALMAAPADGHTLLFTSDDTVTVLPHAGLKLPYDPLQDMVPITQVASTHVALVASQTASFDSFAALAQAARAKPGDGTIATLGPASIPELIANLLARETGVAPRKVPYRGTPNMILAVLSGEIDLAWASAFAVREHVTARKLRLLAIAGPNRNPQFPDVPTFAELGYPKVSMPTWFGLFARKGTAPSIAARINDDVQRQLAQPSFSRDVVEERGFEPGGAAGAEFAKWLQRESPLRAQLLNYRKGA